LGSVQFVQSSRRLLEEDVGLEFLQRDVEARRLHLGDHIVDRGVVARCAGCACRYALEHVVVGDFLQCGRCSRMPLTVTAFRSGSVSMVEAADAGLAISNELATASAQANEARLRIETPPSGRRSF
jgi:hypothetical protein